MLLFLNGYHGNNKNITVVFQMCQTIHPQNYMFVLAVQTEIFDTGYCWIVHLSFLTSHNLLFFRFCKTSKKTTFSVFLSFFLVKSPKSQSLKLNISRTAWPILMILVSFCRILNGLSDEINLFWRCSSPLSILLHLAISTFYTNKIHIKKPHFRAKKNLLNLVVPGSWGQQVKLIAETGYSFWCEKISSINWSCSAGVPF